MFVDEGSKIREPWNRFLLSHSMATFSVQLPNLTLHQEQVSNHPKGREGLGVVHACVEELASGVGPTARSGDGLGTGSLVVGRGTVGQKHTLEALQEGGCMPALVGLAGLEHGLVTVGVDPKRTADGRVVRAVQDGHARAVALQETAAAKVVCDDPDHVLEQVGRTLDDATQIRDGNIQTLTLEARDLAAKRNVVRVLVDQHLGDEAVGVLGPLQAERGRRLGDHPGAGALLAGSLLANRNQNLVLGR